MILEADMRSLGIKNPKLNSGQIEALQKAQDPKTKAIVLVGPTGSGKTNVGVEITKTWMAQSESANVYVITDGMNYWSWTFEKRRKVMPTDKLLETLKER